MAKSILKYTVILFISVLAVRLLYIFITPIPFLFSCGILFAIIYFFIMLVERKNDSLPHYISFFSGFFIFSLFVISLKVLKDYQLPNSNKPYFNNVDHHAIKNYGISFNSGVDLYADEDLPEKGLWPCDTGSFSIKVGSAGAPELHFNQFYKPVFAVNERRESSTLLNPLLAHHVTSGFKIADDQNSLSWQKFEVEDNGNSPKFNMTFVFNSKDKDLLGEFYSKDKNFSDTLIVQGLQLKKGLDLKEILNKAEDSARRLKHAMVFSWLGHFSKIYLVTIKDLPSSNFGLSLFPSNDFFITAKVYDGNSVLTPVSDRTIPFDTTDQFYIGLENSQDLFRIRRQSSIENYLPDNNSYIVEFSRMDMLPLSQAPYIPVDNGSTEVRFLKNSYRQLATEIREGFLFHDDIKDNPLTRFNALLEYQTLPTGSSLSWMIHSLGSDVLTSENNKMAFGLNSENGSITWLFRFTDFSKNGYDFVHAKIYLAILALAMILLVVFKPGINAFYVEAPILFIVYVFFVFRLLLLWRVATFPPLENIKNSEYDSLQFFDFRLMPRILMPFPFSLLMIIFTIASVFVCRIRKLQQWNKRVGTNVQNLSNRIKIINQVPKWFGPWKVIMLHLIALAVGFGLYNIDDEFFRRIIGILYPIALYFYFARKILKKQIAFIYDFASSNFKFISYSQKLIAHWIQTPLFFVSLLTLVYLGVTDTGFAVLFLFFLIIKNILLNFSYPTKDGLRLSSFTNPSNYWIYGVIGLIIFFIGLQNKHAIAFLLENKILMIRIAAVLILLGFVIAKRRSIPKKKNYRQPFLVTISLAAVILVFIPNISKKIETKVDEKIRHVVYRASILFEPVHNMLFDYKYNSFNEQKIIETAQGQWFINSYIDENKTDFVNSRKINFRPHFNKGVDYITQTRDVVLPRYVIAEFGNLTMFLLLLAITVPLVLYFFVYRLTEDNRFHPGSYVGAMTLLLLFTICLFVWLTSTNRFPFFGQDFPFLSLTSKVSSIMPCLLVFILVSQKPLQRFSGNKTVKFNLSLVLFLTLTMLVIDISGKSILLQQERFTINYYNIENSINGEVNDIFTKLQTEQDSKARNITPEDIKSNPDLFTSKARLLLNKLFVDPDFRRVISSVSVYERSILENLRDSPSMGMEFSSPIHLKYNDGILSMVFNRSLHLELPAYEIEKVWKGDIAQETFRSVSESVEPLYYEPVRDRAKVIEVPTSYLKPGTGPLALLNLQAADTRDFVLTYVYNSDSKRLTLMNPGNFVGILGNKDILFITDSKGVYRGSWTLSANKQPYFEYNFQINGRQRQVYPMGDKFFWIYRWAGSNKWHHESKSNFTGSSIISLDFNLTNTVNSFLQKDLKNYASALPDLDFSVIAADGDGKLRLMADFVGKREIIDPNNSAHIARKEREQYFVVDNEAERIQWGNVNLLRMKQGPGSSIKPVVAAAVASQLNLNWESLKYLPQPLKIESDLAKVDRYGGLKLKDNLWEIESHNNVETSFDRYIQKSNNLYHSLIMFLGSYQKDQFYDQNSGTYSLKKILTQKPQNTLCDFPKIGLEDGEAYYLPAITNWPATSLNVAVGGTPTYFGNTNSLLTRGLSANFQVRCEHISKWAVTNQKTNFSKSLRDSSVVDTVLRKGIWTFPEESFFLQTERTAVDQQVNFTKGLRNPSLGGYPYQMTPFKMLELYGKLASMNGDYSVLIDDGNYDTASRWNFDRDSWVSKKQYQKFLGDHIFGAMSSVMKDGGTASSILHTSTYRGYNLYGKTGTIDGQTKEDNSKRLALIISKEPLQQTIGHNNRFYVVYFTIGNAFRSDANKTDKNWFWVYYKKVIDYIIESESFKFYMK